MINIRDQLFVVVHIDGVEITTANVLHALYIHEGGTNYVPTIQLHINDIEGIFSSQRIFIEGAKIDISVSKSFKDAVINTNSFRIVTINSDNSGNGPFIRIYGILDAPKYLSNAHIEGIRGTSDNVLSKIANDCGLTFSGPSEFNNKKMADSQTWLCVSRNRLSFTYQVAKHGYIDDKSCMSFYVTSNKELRYRNLIDVINSSTHLIKHIFVHNALSSDTDNGKQVHLVREAQDVSIAGMMTNWQNYGSTRVEQHLSGNNKQHKSVDVQIPGAYLAINQKVSEQVDRARYDYSPVDCGNEHQNYERALYQNQKMQALFTERLYVLIDSTSNVELFDPVIYRQADTDLTKPVKNSDTYLVLAKTRCIQATHYVEKLLLVRMSLIIGDDDLKNNSAQTSLLPDVKIKDSDITKQVTNSVSLMNTPIIDISNTTQIIENQNASVLDIVTNNRNIIQESVGRIAEGVSNVQSELMILTQPIRDISNQIDGYTQQYNSLYNNINSFDVSVSNATKSVLFSLTGGALEGLCNSASQALALGSVTNAFNGFKELVPNSLKNTVAFKDYSDNLDNLNKSTFGMYNTVSNTWNTSVNFLNTTSINSGNSQTINLLHNTNTTFNSALRVAGIEIGEGVVLSPNNFNFTNWLNSMDTQVNRMQRWDNDF